MTGFVFCMSAIQLLDYKPVRGKVRLYNVTAVHPTLERETRSYFVKYVERIFAERPTVKDEWLTKMKNVEALFAG
jgi:hypothetical protein